MKEFSCHLCTASHFNLVQTSLMLVNTFDFNTCKLKMNWCPSPTLVGQVGPDSRPSVRSDLSELVRVFRTSRTRVGQCRTCRTCRTIVGQVGQSRTSRVRKVARVRKCTHILQSVRVSESDDCPKLVRLSSEMMHFSISNSVRKKSDVRPTIHVSSDCPVRSPI